MHQDSRSIAGGPAHCIHNRPVAGDGSGCDQCAGVGPLALTRAERDRGMALAESARGADWDRRVIDQAIRHLARTGREFSSNDVRGLLPAVRPALIGARFLAASKRGEIKRVGDVLADHKAGHARRVGLWRRAG
jgi:hypothetical protein